MDILYNAFGQIFYFIYRVLAFENYGLAIIVFTILIKVIVLPLTLKSMKSQTAMSALTPEVNKIKEKYKNDQEKQNQETQKLYKDNNVSCAGSCVPMLIQFPLLIGLYTVLRNPMSYMLGKSWEDIGNIANSFMADLELTEKIDVAGIVLENKDAISSVKSISQLNIMNLLNNNSGKLAEVSEYITSDELINLKFLGLNLGLTPTIKSALLFGDQAMQYWPLFILTILAVGLTVISMRLTTKATSAATATANASGAAKKGPDMGKSMQYMMPIMTLYFSFILPASMSLYWICTYAFQIGQQYFINKKRDEDKLKKETEKTEGKKDTGNENKKIEGKKDKGKK